MVSSHNKRMDHCKWTYSYINHLFRYEFFQEQDIQTNTTVPGCGDTKVRRGCARLHVSSVNYGWVIVVYLFLSLFLPSRSPSFTLFPLWRRPPPFTIVPLFDPIPRTDLSSGVNDSGNNAQSEWNQLVRIKLISDDKTRYTMVWGMCIIDRFIHLLSTAISY